MVWETGAAHRMGRCDHHPERRPVRGRGKWCEPNMTRSTRMEAQRKPRTELCLESVVVSARFHQQDRRKKRNALAFATFRPDAPQVN